MKKRNDEAFRTRVNNATQLSHENIVEVYDVQEDEECFFLIMEYRWTYFIRIYT